VGSLVELGGAWVGDGVAVEGGVADVGVGDTCPGDAGDAGEVVGVSCA
jgi:hypothetical protein